MGKNDYFKKSIKISCTRQDISPKRARFDEIENLVTINIKNHLKEGVDLECLKILNIIHQTVIPLGIKYSEQLDLYPGGNRLDRVVVSFDKKSYTLLNQKLIGDK
ncbi:hypothetical protein ABWW58_11685 [Sporolactobacillus sp. STCC-11]|uniref:hypothetical protein n=1 Tax=Sporolactobacillus caesalpiniae TaxID=3230362 RepID=UPI003390944E